MKLSEGKVGRVLRDLLELREDHFGKTLEMPPWQREGKTCNFPVTSANTHTCTAPAPEVLQIVPPLPLMAYVVFICWEGKGAEAQEPDEELAGSYLLLGGKSGSASTRSLQDEL